MGTMLQGDDGAFDFAKHRTEAIEKYRHVRGLYEAFADVVREILRVSIPAECQIHSIEARAKDPQSFGDKAALAADADSSRPRYSDPLKSITDLAGVRVIVFFPKTIAGVNDCIVSEFDVTEKTDKAEELMASDKFGYQSIHYLVRLKASRTNLPEYKRFEGLTAEIQLRTILQHAWAEMEHDIQYKPVASMPISIRRRFMSLAGMLEIADREFQAIQDEDERLRAQMRDTVQEGLQGVVNLHDVVAQLEAQIRELQESRASASTYLPGSARALLDKGYFLEAVKAYDNVIQQHPTVHSNFIGRARARFMAGDVENALSDLAKAEALYPLDPVIDRVRQQIQEGQPKYSPGTFVLARAELLRGNHSLSVGDGATALTAYEVAEEFGFYEVYSVFNQAMALCLAGDTAAALSLLDKLEPDEGSFMEVNVVALRTLCALRSGAPHQNLLLELNGLSGMRSFDGSKSPLRYLKAGLTTLDAEPEKYNCVFYLLSPDGDSLLDGKALEVVP